MTLGLVASGRTARIVLLTLLDACLVRAIVLFLGCPSAAQLSSSSLGRPGTMARRAGSRHRNGRRSFFWLGYIGAGCARPPFQEVYLYVGKVLVCWSFVVAFLREYTLLRTARAELP